MALESPKHDAFRPGNNIDPNAHMSVAPMPMACRNDHPSVSDAHLHSDVALIPGWRSRCSVASVEANRQQTPLM